MDKLLKDFKSAIADLPNASLIISGEGRVNNFIQDYNPVVFVYRPSVDVREWFKTTTLFSKEDGSTGVRTEDGVMLQEIKNGSTILIADLDRALKQLYHIETQFVLSKVVENPGTHFCFTMTAQQDEQTKTKTQIKRLTTKLELLKEQLQTEYPNHCTSCSGQGGRDDYDGEWLECGQCYGEGKHPLDTTKTMSDEEADAWVEVRREKMNPLLLQVLQTEEELDCSEEHLSYLEMEEAERAWTATYESAIKNPYST